MDKSAFQEGKDRMIIDCHVHLNQYEDNERLALEDRAKLLHDTMGSNGVDHAVVLSSYKVNEDRPSTAQLVEFTKKYDNIAVVAGFSIDNHDQNYLQSCRRWIKDGLVKGMKIYCGYEHHYPSDLGYKPVCDMCIEFGVPLMIHTGDTFSAKGKLKFSHPLNVDDLAVDNPELKIVMCHLGNPWIQDCMEIIYKNDNVYADISGLVVGDFTHYFEKMMTLKFLELLNYAAKPERLMYGTDWPIATMESYLNFVSKIKIGENSRRLLMYKNARDLFRI
jgi:predicted TIM-barrel fold metal-dependent hydrolase